MTVVIQLTWDRESEKDQHMQGTGHQAESKMLTYSKCFTVANVSTCICLLYISNLPDIKKSDDLFVKHTQTQGIHNSETSQPLLDWNHRQELSCNNATTLKNSTIGYTTGNTPFTVLYIWWRIGKKHSQTPPCRRSLNHHQCKHESTKNKCRNDVILTTQLYANVRKHIPYKLMSPRVLGRVP